MPFPISKTGLWDAKSLADRVSKAEMLLARIAQARIHFSLDPGGPPNALEGLYVIEKWIEGYFDGSYYGDIGVEPVDPALRPITMVCGTPLVDPSWGI